jgi:hypothetical protein
MPIAIPFEHGRELGVHGIWIYAPSNHNAPQTCLPGGQRLKVLERMPQVAPGRERPKALPQGPLPARPAPLVGRATLVDNIALGGPGRGGITNRQGLKGVQTNPNPIYGTSPDILLKRKVISLKTQGNKTRNQNWSLRYIFTSTAAGGSPEARTSTAPT